MENANLANNANLEISLTWVYMSKVKIINYVMVIPRSNYIGKQEWAFD